MFRTKHASLVVTSVLLQCMVVVAVTRGNRLYWRPEKHEGLFSKFIQLRIIMAVAQRLGDRTVYITPAASCHFPKATINLCKTFALGPKIVCLEKHEIEDYGFLKEYDIKREWENVLMRGYAYPADHKHFKFPYLLEGSPRSFLSETNRDAVLQAVNLNYPPLRVNDRFEALVYDMKRQLGIIEINNTAVYSELDRNGTLHSRMRAMTTLTNKTYTVVHWRRGDQLATRCLQHKDSSVNCRSAVQLIAAVRKLTNDSIVYVATNEEVTSKELESLRREGFKLFSDTKSRNTYNSLATFVVEIALMLGAHKLLAWGVSEVNDVVELERKTRGLSFCLAEDDIVEYPTWCWWHRHVKNQNGSSARRSELQSQDPHPPFSRLEFLKGFNTSGMPAYERERNFAIQESQSRHNDVDVMKSTTSVNKRGNNNHIHAKLRNNNKMVNFNPDTFPLQDSYSISSLRQIWSQHWFLFVAVAALLLLRLCWGERQKNSSSSSGSSNSGSETWNKKKERKGKKRLGFLNKKSSHAMNGEIDLGNDLIPIQWPAHHVDLDAGL